MSNKQLEEIVRNRFYFLQNKLTNVYLEVLKEVKSLDIPDNTFESEKKAQKMVADMFKESLFR